MLCPLGVHLINILHITWMQSSALALQQCTRCCISKCFFFRIYCHGDGKTSMTKPHSTALLSSTCMRSSCASPSLPWLTLCGLSLSHSSSTTLLSWMQQMLGSNPTPAGGNSFSFSTISLEAKKLVVPSVFALTLKLLLYNHCYILMNSVLSWK